MTRLALELSLPAVAARKGGGAAGGAAGAMLQNETNGLAFNASDDSMVIKDTTTPANNYSGSAIIKFGNVRASAALQYGSTNLVEWAPENLITYSQFFDAGYWGFWDSVTSIPDAITAPDGTLTADKLVEVASNTYHRVTKGASSKIGHVTFSVYLKAAERTFAQIAFNSGDGTSINLATGTLGVALGTLVSRTITDAGNGWYRVSITRNYATEFTYCQMAIALTDTSTWEPVYLGDVTKGIYVWGAQCENSSTARAYLPTTSSEVYALRRDYDPRVTGPKYLVEDVQTNAVLYSNALSNAAWTPSYVTFAQNATGIDGTTSAWTMTDNATNGQHRFFQTPGTVAGSYSLYAKAGTAGFVGISNDAAGYAVFNLGSGVVALTSGCTAAIELSANGFYRCIMYQTVAGPFFLVNMGRTAAEATVGTNYSGTGSTIILTGLQLEVAATSASSYIPTTSATVTRAAEDPKIAMSAIPSSPTELTVYVELDFGPTSLLSGTRGLFGINYYANPDGVNVFMQGGQIYSLVTPDSYVDIQLVSGGVSLARNKVAVAAEVTAPNAVQYRNGTLDASQSTGGPFGTMNYAGLYFVVGAWGQGNQIQLNGWVLNGMFLPRRMSNAELATLTTP